MNTPYLWFPPEDYPQSILGSCNYQSSPDRVIFIEGKPLTERILTPSFQFTAPLSRVAKLDILPNTIGVPLISQRVASLLTEICPAEFQLIPSQIETRDAPLDGYSILNVLVEISGIDHARSSIHMLAKLNCIISIRRLRYASGAMGAHHLARDREYSPFLWVSDEVVRKFALANFRCYEFKPPEAIHP